MSKKKNYSSKSRNISKKGILLTCVIIVSVFGASFIIWFLPQGNAPENTGREMTIVFSDPQETLSSVNSQFELLKEEMRTNVETSNNGSDNTSLNNMTEISIKQINDLMLVLLNGNPPESILPDYLKLMNDLKNYSYYLNMINDSKS